MTVAAASLLALNVAALADEQKGNDPESTQESRGVEQAPILTAAIPEVSGPKRTVAVGKFDAIGAFTAKYGNWDIGGGLSAMLTSALVESKRFIVVERANIKQILSEQELKGARLTNPATGPETGKLVGVQMMIYGAVTEFSDSDKGGGFSIGGSGGGIGNLISGALSQQSSTGSIAMDLRLVDTTSGQVTESHRISDEVNSSGWDLNFGYSGINMGTNDFYKTPLGEASRRLITKAVQLIAREAENTPWTGQVVDFDGEEIYINAGGRAGIKAGDKFMVERIVRRLTDPVTHEVLSIRRKPLGIVEIKGVEPKIAYGSFQPIDVAAPQRGDYVAIVR